MTTKRLTYITWALIILSSCQTNYKHHDFGKFTIELPSSWKTIDIQGIDSYVKQIVTDTGDTLQFDLGYYSNTLEESVPILIPKSDKELLLKEGIDTTGIIFLDSVEQESYKEFLIQQRQEIVIDGFNAHLVSPKQPESGITGVYFDSIGNGTMGNIRLNFYGVNLKGKEQNRLLNALQTIKIKTLANNK
jgi:hypothetical protein